MGLSEELEFHGRIGLHSLPQADGFYANTCGMTDLGADPAHQGSALLRDDTGAGAGLYRKGEFLIMIEISKEWCIRMARYEGDAEIGAGQLSIDPVFDGDPVSAEE